MSERCFWCNQPREQHVWQTAGGDMCWGRDTCFLSRSYVEAEMHQRAAEAKRKAGPGGGE